MALPSRASRAAGRGSETACAAGGFLHGRHGEPRDGRAYRLPTEAEWEKAARGADGRAYPWGNRFDATLCKMPDASEGPPQPEPVGAFPTDESPCGVRHPRRRRLRVVRGLGRRTAVAALRARLQLEQRGEVLPRGTATPSDPTDLLDDIADLVADPDLGVIDELARLELLAMVAEIRGFYDPMAFPSTGVTASVEGFDEPSDLAYSIASLAGSGSCTGTLCTYPRAARRCTRRRAARTRAGATPATRSSGSPVLRR